MWKYLKAAFFVGVDMPALGRVPVNILASAAFVIFGFVQPAFWLLGLAAETMFVFSLAFNRRFQKYVDSRELQLNEIDVDAQRRALIALLAPDAKRKLSALIDRCNQVLQVCAGTQADEFTIAANREALQKLQWLYLKLLVGRHYLEAASGSDTDSLKSRIAALENELKDRTASESLLQSKSATLSILKQRWANLQNRKQLMEEIDSDMARIEAQTDLALENATVQGRPQAISTEIELASDLMGGTLFGESQNAIAAIDHTYSQTKSTPQVESN